MSVTIPYKYGPYKYLQNIENTTCNIFLHIYILFQIKWLGSHLLSMEQYQQTRKNAIEKSRISSRNYTHALVWQCEKEKNGVLYVDHFCRVCSFKLGHFLQMQRTFSKDFGNKHTEFFKALKIVIVMRMMFKFAESFFICQLLMTFACLDKN